MFVWAVPFLWVAAEFLKSLGDIGFPWLLLGHTQTYYPVLLQYCAYTGVYGVSFWVCLLNVVIFQTVQSAGWRRQALWITAGIFLIIIPYIHGRSVMKDFREPGPVMRTAMIQGNIDPWAKWDKKFKEKNFKTYENYSHIASIQNPDLLIWPESAATSYLRYDARYLTWTQRIVDSTGVPLLTGALDAEFESGSTGRSYYNSAFLFLPGGTEFQDYAKMQLVPFSERVPWAEYMPSYVRFNLVEGFSDFTPGSKFTVFHLPRSVSGIQSTHFRQGNLNPARVANEDWSFATIICYESIFSGLVRKFCMNPVDFLVIITNDAWFGRSSAPYQHAQAAVFRAIENRIAIARCANTGISMYINPLGEVQSQTPIYEPAVLTVNAAKRGKLSFYTRYGEWFPWSVVA